MAASSSFLVEMTLPSLLLIFHEELPSLVNRRVMTMLLPNSLGLYASSPWFLRVIVTSETLLNNMGQDAMRCDNGNESYDCPSRMNDLRPFPRPVEVALPPRATVMAERTALLPPSRRTVNKARID